MTTLSITEARRSGCIIRRKVVGSASMIRDRFGLVRPCALETPVLRGVAGHELGERVYLAARRARDRAARIVATPGFAAIWICTADAISRRLASALGRGQSRPAGA